jgi:hypothetical protein
MKRATQGCDPPRHNRNGGDTAWSRHMKRQGERPHASFPLRAFALKTTPRASLRPCLENPGVRGKAPVRRRTGACGTKRRNLRSREPQTTIRAWKNTPNRHDHNLEISFDESSALHRIGRRTGVRRTRGTGRIGTTGGIGRTHKAKLGTDTKFARPADLSRQFSEIQADFSRRRQNAPWLRGSSGQFSVCPQGDFG